MTQRIVQSDRFTARLSAADTIEDTLFAGEGARLVVSFGEQSQRRC